MAETDVKKVSGYFIDEDDESSREPSNWDSSTASTFSSLGEEENIELLLDEVANEINVWDTGIDDDYDDDEFEDEVDSFQFVSEDCSLNSKARKWKKNEDFRRNFVLSDQSVIETLVDFYCLDCRQSRSCMHNHLCRDTLGSISESKNLITKLRMSYWMPNGTVSGRKTKLLSDLYGFLNFDLLRQISFIDYKISGRRVCKSFFKEASKITERMFNDCVAHVLEKRLILPRIIPQKVDLFLMYRYEN
jgi:hypothetical protein